MKLAHIDPSDLLAYVEGSLSTAQSDALERRLARDPEGLLLLHRMRSDRVRLQALPDVSPPAHLMADLEARFARPMLLAETGGGSPGRYGRHHRRRMRSRQMLRPALAVAAALLLAGLSWWSFQTWLRPLASHPQDHRSHVAGAPDITAPAESQLPPARRERGIPTHPTAIAHMLPPLPPRATALDRTPPEALPGAVASAVRIIAAPLVLYIAADDADQLELLLLTAVHGIDPSKAIRGMSGSATLVRNLSEQDLHRALVRAGLEGLPAAAIARPPITASGDAGISAPRGGDAQATLDALRRLGDGATGDALATGRTPPLLSGPDAWQPPLDHQLAMSALGATHSITTDPATLGSVIERLNASHEAIGRGPLALLLPEDSGRSAPRAAHSRPLSSWVADLAEVRRILAELQANGAAKSPEPESLTLISIPVIRF